MNELTFSASGASEIFDDETPIGLPATEEDAETRNPQNTFTSRKIVDALAKNFDDMLPLEGTNYNDFAKFCAQLIIDGIRKSPKALAILAKHPRGYEHLFDNKVLQPEESPYLSIAAVAAFPELDYKSIYNIVKNYPDSIGVERVGGQFRIPAPAVFAYLTTGYLHPYMLTENSSPVDVAKLEELKIAFQEDPLLFIATQINGTNFLVKAWNQYLEDKKVPTQDKAKYSFLNCCTRAATKRQAR